MWKRIMSLAGVWALLTNIIWGQTVHFQEGFGTTTPGSIPAGWTLRDGGQAVDQTPPLDYDSTWTVVDNYLGRDLGQGNFLFIRYNSNLTQGDTIETPIINVTSPTGDVYLGYLTFYNSLGSGDSGIVEVFDGTTWQRLVKYGNGNDVGGWGNNAAWEVFNITSFVNPNLKVRFIYHDLNDWYWAVDSVTVFSGCIAPDSITVSWLSATDAVLTYSGSYDSIRVEYGPTGFTPGTGTIVTLSGTSPDTITGLSWNNGYDFYVWFYCGNAVSFDTLLLPVCPTTLSVPYIESFDNQYLLSTTCWTTNDNDVVLIGFDTACSLDGGYIQLWGQDSAFAESPSISVTPGAVYIISYYYRAGNASCGEKPDAGDQVVVEWFDTGWHQLALYDGGTAPDVWTQESYAICPASSTIKVRFLIVNGTGATFDSWQFDSLEITAGPTSPDVKVVSVSNVGLACGSTGVDTFIVAYTNYGTATDTVWVELTTPAGTQTVVVDYTAQGGFGGCNDLNNIDTVVVTGNITSLGAVPIKVFAKGVSDADLADTVKMSFPYGEMWVYIDINTNNFGSEVYWKLFYMPDSILVKEVPAGTYASNSSYTDSFCAVPGATYRFEAWDSWGDGWNGGTYQIYVISCNDTIVLADNGGASPSGPGKLEAVEYFVVAGNDVKTTSVFQPDTTACVDKPVNISVAVTNYFGSSVQGDVHISFSPIGTGTSKDTLFTNVTIGTCLDTLNFVVYDIVSGSYALTVITAVPGDAMPNNDTLFVDTVLVIDSIPTPPLGQANITACSKETPIVLDATITGYNPVTYSWNTGSSGAVINVTNSGTYVVTITYGPGCVLIDSAIVTINPSPQASIIGPDIVDANIPNTYNASPTGTNYTYQWNTGDTTATITYTAPTPGKDTLWVIVTNEFGCADTAYKIIEVITGVENALAYSYQLRYHQVEAIAQIITGKDLIEWVEVRDVAGRTIERRMVGDRDVTLSLKALPRGTYFVVVKGQQAGTIVYKLLR